MTLPMRSLRMPASVAAEAGSPHGIGLTRTVAHRPVGLCTGLSVLRGLAQLVSRLQRRIPRPRPACSDTVPHLAGRRLWTDSDSGVFRFRPLLAMDEGRRYDGRCRHCCRIHHSIQHRRQCRCHRTGRRGRRTVHNRMGPHPYRTDASAQQVVATRMIHCRIIHTPSKEFDRRT